MKKIVGVIIVLLLGYSFLTNPNEQEHLDVFKGNLSYSKFEKIKSYLSYNNYFIFSTLNIDIEELSAEMAKAYIETAGDILNQAEDIEDTTTALKYYDLASGYMGAYESYDASMTIGYFFNVRKQNEFDDKIKGAFEVLDYR